MWWLLLGVAMADEPAYEGTTAVEEELEESNTNLSVELGGAYATGNAVSITTNAMIRFEYDWKTNRFAAFAGTLLNLSKVDRNGNGTLDPEERDDPLVWSQQKFFGGLRYDRYFNERSALYAAGAVERDPLAGLEWRFNEQIGYRHKFIENDTTNLHLETGLAYNQENFATGADGIENADRLDAHYLAARVFVGFQHEINETVVISDGLVMIEPLVGSFATGGLTNWEDFRLTNDLSLGVTLSEKFSLKYTFLIQFDNQPVPGFMKLDTTNLLTLVASII